MRDSISTILDKADKIEDRNEKIGFLQSQGSTPLKTVLQYAYHPEIKWLLPEGDPPYKPSEFLDNDGILFTESRRLYIFIEGGNPNLAQLKREMLFMQLLEAVTPTDAKLLCAIKEKHLPYSTLVPSLINDAFPGLIGDGPFDDSFRGTDENEVSEVPEVIEVSEVSAPVKKPGPSKGVFWWTDGVNNIRSVESPGPNFSRGRAGAFKKKS